VCVCSLSMTVPSGHMIILMLSRNVGIRSSCVKIEVVSSGGIVVGSYLLPGRFTAQKYHNFVNTPLLGLIKGVSLVVWQSLWFQRDGASAHYGQDVQ